ncbi:hypothetical protein [Natrinema marinum]|uniref:hypothetical protein n=1 Tax=Natrinema marinum TaxID=2961598 RepID=UPI0020C86BBE|nr:hypothetical protein [Natrinema marinum]
MVDPRLLRRIDILLALLALWIVLTLVLGSFVLMAFDTVTGVLALATVVLVVVISAYSYLRYSEGTPE